MFVFTVLFSILELYEIFIVLGVAGFEVLLFYDV